MNFPVIDELRERIKNRNRPVKNVINRTKRKVVGVLFLAGVFVGVVAAVVFAVCNYFGG